MKNVKHLLVALVAVVFCMSFSVSKAGDPEKAQTIEYSLEDLQAIYGENIVLDGDMSLDNIETVQFLLVGNPCARSSFGKCGPVEAKARRNAQRQADNCCCVVTYGWQCCDPANGNEIAVLAIATPKDNCN